MGGIAVSSSLFNGLIEGNGRGNFRISRLGLDNRGLEGQTTLYGLDDGKILTVFNRVMKEIIF